VKQTTQLTLGDKVRLSPRVSRDVVRLAKSRAAAQELTLEYVIEQLLKAWVTKQIKLPITNDDKQ
jgi:hypothetical protein